jgi:glycosyltransferase involved in cell wall biosynthesis
MPAPAKITIGVPVYNGANYLPELLASIAQQTCQDYRVVISDNASTDETAVVARGAAAADPRISYHRNPINIGGNCNFDKVFSYCETPYFMWLGHDDQIAPEFLETCVAGLESDAGIVQSGCRTQYIDGQGNPIPVNPETGFYDAPFLHTPHPVEREHLAGSADPIARFSDFFPDYSRSHVFALMRADAVRGTSMMGPRFNGPTNFLCELALRGRFTMSERPLLLRRFHDECSEALSMTDRVRYVTAGERQVQRRFLESTRSFLEGILRTETLAYGQRARLVALVLSHAIRNGSDEVVRRAAAAIDQRARLLLRTG